MVFARGRAVPPSPELRGRGKRTVGEIGPDASFRIRRVGFVQVVGVPRGIERLHAAVAALELTTGGTRRGGPAFEREPDRLPEVIQGRMAHQRVRRL